MSKTVHIFKHSHSEGACYLGKVLQEHGFKIRSFGVPNMDFSEYDINAADMLMFMGSPTGVYQADLFPFIYDEISLIQKAVDLDKPVFGICFGSQLIAKALGGDVYPGDQGTEVGWHPLHLTEDGKKSPARHLGADKTNMFHWHGDTFDLPKGAKLLASSDQYKQIFSYGDKVIGLQCHAEIRRKRLNEWYVSLVDVITGDNPIIPIAQLRYESDKYVDRLNEQVRIFLGEWLQKAGLLS